MLNFVEGFQRDASRFTDLRARINLSPLGSGALAGSTLPIDRDAVAQTLGFGGIADNSIDAVSDRDPAVEYVFACSLLSARLSRFAADWGPLLLAGVPIPSHRRCLLHRLFDDAAEAQSGPAGAHPRPDRPGLRLADGPHDDREGPADGLQ